MFTRNSNDLYNPNYGFASGDILKRLRSVPLDGGLMGMSWASDAANEIERLRSDVRRLEALKDQQEQFNAGYARAKEDIRRALGIED